MKKGGVGSRRHSANIVSAYTSCSYCTTLFLPDCEHCRGGYNKAILKKE